MRSKRKRRAGPESPGLERSTIAARAAPELRQTIRTEVRRREKEREASRPKVGSPVKILKGRPRYVGKVGTAVIVRKSRCFVSVPGIASPAYCLISEVDVVA